MTARDPSIVRLWAGIDPPLQSYHLQFQKCSRIGPFAFFFLELPALIYQDLAVIREADRESFQGSRCWAFEINACFVVAAAVARALVLLFRFQPVGCAAEMGAHG